MSGLLASGGAIDTPMLPAPVVTLLDRVEGKAGVPFASVGELVSAIGSIEQAGSDPTQAYVPEVRPLSGSINSPEAPTLAAPIVSVMPAADVGNMATQELNIAELEDHGIAAPVEQRFAATVPERPRGFNSPVLIGVLGAVAAILLLFVVVPRLVDSRGASATEGPVVPTPTAEAMVAAPDLKGMKLEEAKVLATGYGLNVVLGASAEDKALPPDSVLNQEPPSGTLVQSGSVITVSLNVVTQAQPDPPPTIAPVQDVQPAAQEPPQVTGAENAKKDNENKGKGKDKGKDK